MGQAVGRQVSYIRSVVEHAIAALKNWTILSTGYRHRLNELPDTITLATKLELYRTGW
ncbi:hypothetical protein SAMN05216355_11022 [Actinomyces ruminicola]|uniref:DDE superfamily endonuclease n=1 Tax=Actinomyces ruminicola TaxID=332524 RepID=A0A1H0DCW4_9ACTO|nr:hypothetical protein SAMN05216355_11022 [Actinomyces ruminicola]